MLTHQALVQGYNPRSYHSLFLGADVGGTNFRIVLAGLRNAREGERQRLEMVALSTGKTADVHDFHHPLKEALDYVHRQFGGPVRAIAIAAAGPVQGHRWCRLTNFDLEIDAEVLGDKVNTPCFIVNDFEAVGYSISYLEEEKPEALLPVERGRRIEGSPGTRALLGIGTGLGKGILVSNSELGFHIALPSEGGHADFPAGDALEWEMVRHIKEVTGFPVCWEDILSGRGLGNLYSYLRTRNLHPASETTALIDGGADKAAAISRHYRQDETAGHAVQMLVSIFARCAKNFSLDVLPRGGVYLGGGVVAKNLDWFTDGRFIEEFERHRQYGPLLEQMPVNIIISDEAGTYGAAFVASKGEELWSRLL